MGAQYYQRARGTGTIVQRSFPFWHTDLTTMIEYARTTNKLKKDDERRTNWTHMVIHTRLVETAEGASKALRKEVYEEHKL